MNNIELNKVAIQSIGIDTIRLPGVGSASAKGSGSLFHKSLVDAWFMSGYSNDNPPASIKGTKGHELVLKNFAFAGSSGFGKYSVNKITWANTNRCERIDVDYLTYTFVNITESNNSILQYVEGGTRFSAVGNIVKVRVAGIPEGGKVNIGNYITNITEDGVYEGSFTYDANGNTSISTTNCIGATITVEFLPDNAGSLVFDGVDDYTDVIPEIKSEKGTIIIKYFVFIDSIKGMVLQNKTKIEDSFYKSCFVISSDSSQMRDENSSSVSISTPQGIEYTNVLTWDNNGMKISSHSKSGTVEKSTTALNKAADYTIGRDYNSSQCVNFCLDYIGVYSEPLMTEVADEQISKLNEIWTKRLNR